MNLAKDSGKQKLTGVQKAAILFITLWARSISWNT